MPFKFNPLTGSLDLVNTSSASGSSDDHHSGWFNIISASTVTVSTNKQMVVFDEFTLDGIINVDGQLIIEE